MTIQETREYFRSFSCEPLTSSERNQEEIQSFSSKIRDNSLENYLKQDAWQQDQEGITKVYLIRDTLGRIVCFFSLKCGAVFTTNPFDDQYRALSALEKDCIKFLVDTRKQHDDQLYYSTCDTIKLLCPGTYTLLSQIADYRYHSKNESLEAGDIHNVLKVDSCCSAIEIQHFCKSDEYPLSPDVGFPLGFGLFWEVIVPKIQSIAETVGCEYIYLFAADRSDNPDERHLISYYKDSLSFYDVDDEGVVVLKPAYDNNCIALLQRVPSLSNVREDAWERFADHATSS